MGEGERPEEKGSQREGHLASAEAPACSTREAHFVRTNGKEPELLEPIRMNSWPNVQKEIKDLDCKGFFFLLVF